MSKLRKGAEFMLKKFHSTNKNKFRIVAEQRRQMQDELSCSTGELMNVLLDIFKEKAFAEISGFHVAAAALGYSGDIYMGVNLETPFATLGHTVHAEQFVIVNAHRSKEAGLSQFVVSDFPCGHCRQFLFELPDAENINVQVPSKGVDLQLAKLLPHSFSGKTLNPDCPTLLSSTPLDHHLRLHSRRSRALQNLEEKALDAVNASFAPYSHCPAGVAVMLNDETLFSGSYIESCAFNPSISPMLSTVVEMVMQGEARLSDISHAVIVEQEGAKTSQYGSVKEVLSKFAPEATFTRLFARPETEEERQWRHLQHNEP